MVRTCFRDTGYSLVTARVKTWAIEQILRMRRDTASPLLLHYSSTLKRLIHSRSWQARPKLRSAVNHQGEHMREQGCVLMLGFLVTVGFLGA